MSLSPIQRGRVALVGAGPGDPGLITVRGRDILQQADVVVYDHLVAEELVNLVPAAARRIYVGKKAGKHTLSQKSINDLMVQEARAGNFVVRLKGGDPFVFGRGAEECLHLYENGVEFEVVPGVSALASVPAYAGIPLTYRNLSAAFVAVTGHEDITKKESAIDWSAVARVEGTLVIFMGILCIRQIFSDLVAHGMRPDTPAAVIRWGTYARQETYVGTLASLPDWMENIHLRPPGLIIVGEVVRLREKLAWFEKNDQ